jgi:hypothetical protein
MGAKLKSKTHLQNTFFWFLIRFLRVWLQSLKKVLIWPIIFFFFKSKKVSKNAEFHADFESVEKVKRKNAPKKVISKTSLTNMSKSEKSAYFRHGFANNFFLVHFFKPFSTDSKSAWNSAFFNTQIEFLKKKIFFCSYEHFFETLIANAQETAQKNGKSFFMKVS